VLVILPKVFLALTLFPGWVEMHVVGCIELFHPEFEIHPVADRKGSLQAASTLK